MGAFAPELHSRLATSYQQDYCPRTTVRKPPANRWICPAENAMPDRLLEAPNPAVDLILGGDNRPTSVYANNCKSPDLVQMRGVLYYSSAGFFLLQLEQACSVLPPSVVPVTNAGVPAGKDGNRVDELGTGYMNPW
jgi:hypothetical protein